MIKVKATPAKEASVSIGMSPMAAEVLRLFMVKAMDKVDMSEVVMDIYADLNEEIEQDDIATVIMELVAGLDE